MPASSGRVSRCRAKDMVLGIKIQGRETRTCLGGLLQIHIPEPPPYLLNQNSWMRESRNHYSVPVILQVNKS